MKKFLFLLPTIFLLCLSAEQKSLNQSTVRQLYVLDHKFPVNTVLLDQIGNRLITASFSIVWHINIFNLMNGSLLHMFDASSEDIELSPNGKLLMLDTVLYSMESYKKMYEFENPYEYIVGKKFISNTQIAIVGEVDDTICVTKFDINTKEMTSLGCKKISHVKDYLWSPQNTYFAMITYEKNRKNQKFLCWNLKTNSYFEIDNITSAAFNANDRKIALIEKAPPPYTIPDKLIIIDAQTNQRLQQYEFNAIANITWGSNLLGITQYTEQNVAKTLIIDLIHNKQICTVPLYAYSIDKSDKLMVGKDLTTGTNYLFNPLTCSLVFNTHSLVEKYFKESGYLISIKTMFADIWIQLKEKQELHNIRGSLQDIFNKIRQAKSLNEIHYYKENLEKLLPQNIYEQYIGSKDIFGQKTYEENLQSIEFNLPRPLISFPYFAVIFGKKVYIYILGS